MAFIANAMHQILKNSKISAIYNDCYLRQSIITKEIALLQRKNPSFCRETQTEKNWLD